MISGKSNLQRNHIKILSPHSNINIASFGVMMKIWDFDTKDHKFFIAQCEYRVKRRADLESLENLQFLEPKTKTIKQGVIKWEPFC